MSPFIEVLRSKTPAQKSALWHAMPEALIRHLDHFPAALPVVYVYELPRQVQCTYTM